MMRTGQPRERDCGNSGHPSSTTSGVLNRPGLYGDPVICEPSGPRPALEQSREPRTRQATSSRSRSAASSCGTSAPICRSPPQRPSRRLAPDCPEEFGLGEAIDGLCERIVVGVAGGAHRGSKTSGWESGRAEERLNKEIRRRREVVGIFAGRASDICLVGALIIDWTEEWADERRSMSARGPCQGPTGTVPRR